MQGQKWTLLLSLVFLVVTRFQAVLCADKLVCQFRPAFATAEEGATPPPPPPPTSLLVRKAGVKPTHCCGGRPFNSDLSLCCLGKVLSQTHRKCCLDGSNVPKASRCRCYPTSTWLIQQLEKLSDLEFELTALLENLDRQVSTMRQSQCLTTNGIQILTSLSTTLAQPCFIRKVLSKEEVLGVLDAKANRMFQALIQLLGIDRNQALGEVDDIIAMIRFLNTNEDYTAQARKNAHLFEESFVGLVDVAKDGTASSDDPGGAGTNGEEEDVRENLRRIRREIEELERSARAAESLSNQVNRQLDEEMSTSKSEQTRKIVLERDRILSEILAENRVLRKLKDRLQAMERIKKILEADRALLVNLRGMLDTILDEVIRMEAAEMEEGEVDQRVGSRRRRSNEEEKWRIFNNDEARGSQGFQAESIDPSLLRPTLSSLEEGEEQTSLNPPNSDGGGGSPAISSSLESPSVATSSLTLNTTVSVLKPTTTITTTTATKNKSSKTPRPCDFAAWERYVATFVRRRDLTKIDLGDLLSPVADDTRDTLTPTRSRVERSFFANRVGGLSLLNDRESPPVRQRRDASAQQANATRHVLVSQRLEMSRLFRATAFKWLDSLGHNIDRNALRERILPLLRKSQIK